MTRHYNLSRNTIDKSQQEAEKCLKTRTPKSKKEISLLIHQKIPKALTVPKQKKGSESKKIKSP